MLQGGEKPAREIAWLFVPIGQGGGGTQPRIVEDYAAPSIVLHLNASRIHVRFCLHLAQLFTRL